MTIERWSPFRDFLNLQNEVDHAVRRTVGRPLRRATLWSPAMESFARGDDLVVKLELPGIDPEKVEISIKDDILRVWGERHQHESVSDEDYYRAEFEYGSFERTLALPKEARADDIKATYEKGVLEIVVPKAAAVAEARKVPIHIKK